MHVFDIKTPIGRKWKMINDSDTDNVPHKYKLMPKYFTGRVIQNSSQAELERWIEELAIPLH
ncbi:hypothetical protein ACE6H2_018875 [Prunus campanulata]